MSLFRRPPALDDSGRANRRMGARPACGVGRLFVAMGRCGWGQDGHALWEGASLVRAAIGHRSADVEREDLVSGAVESIGEQASRNRVRGVTATGNEFTGQIRARTTVDVDGGGHPAPIDHGCGGRPTGWRRTVHAGER